MKKLVSLQLLMLSMLICVASAEAVNSVSVRAESDEGVDIDVLFDDYDFSRQPNSGFSVMEAGDYGILKNSGAPGVPARSFLVEVPADARITLEVTSLATKSMGNVVLAPAPTMEGVRGADGTLRPVRRFVMNDTVYQSDAPYPGKLAEVDYTGVLRDRHVAKINLYPVQYNPARQELVIHTRMRVAVDFAGSGREADLPQARSRDAASTGAGVFEGIYRRSLLNYTSGAFPARRQRPGRLSAPVQPLSSDLASSPFAVKVTVEAEGMYMITYEDLVGLGVDLSSATGENLQMSHRNRDIAVYCSGSGSFGPGDYIVFYGQSFKSLYTKKNVYWLYQAAGDGLRMQSVDASPVNAYELQTAFRAVYHAEQDTLYWQNMPPFTDGLDHWLWSELNINVAGAGSHDYSVGLYNLQTGSGTYALRLNLKGETNLGLNPDHHTRVSVNGTPVDDFTWDGQQELVRDIESIEPAVFREGENTITIEAVNDLGAGVDSYYVNWFEIRYWDGFTAEMDSLRFAADMAGGARFRIDGFSGGDVRVYNVSDPYSVKMMTGGTVTGSAADYTISFQDVLSAETQYCAVGPDGYLRPEELTLDEASDLRTVRDNVDYIIITHERFYDAVQDLKRYRESLGLNVEVVKIQDVYDEFSAGIKDITAVKDFLTYAYNNWHAADHPAYVVLVGDATLDYRDDLGMFAVGREDFVPTSIFQTSILGDTPSDNWFVCVDGTDFLPDMLIGRLSVKTVEDLQAIIAKIKSYEASNLEVWHSNVIFAADDEQIFESISDSLAEYLPLGYTPQKVYVSQYESITAATRDLTEKINAGAVITNYTGHGHVDEWAAPYLFHTPDAKGNNRNDMDALTNSDKLTFVLIMNCLSGFFPNWKDDYSLAEEFVRSANKGAIACFAATNSGYPSEHRVLAKNVLENFFIDEITVAGALITTAKIAAYQQLSSRDIVDAFVLLGDPATQLRLISPSDIGPFDLVAPESNQALAKWPPSQFEWGEGLYERFKVQYSTETAFSSETTITVPLLPFLTVRSGTYNPNVFIWFLLRAMNRQNERIYWRVVAYDDDFNVISTTNYRNFTIEQ